VTALSTARLVAAILAAVMTVYFLVTDAVRADNPFLVPDLLLSVLLVVTASLPARWAAPALVFAFGLAAGVWTVSLSHYAVRGELVDGLDHLPLIGACVILSLFLVRGLVRGPAGRPVEAPHSSSPVRP
jgi:ABC-type dipeptide/oligopeptide/nickel transport system permease component